MLWEGGELICGNINNVGRRRDSGSHDARSRICWSATSYCFDTVHHDVLCNTSTIRRIYPTFDARKVIISLRLSVAVVEVGASLLGLE